MVTLTDPTILVIAPDALVRDIIGAILRSHHYQACSAKDQQTALQLAHQLDVDLIICDEDIDVDRGGQLIRCLRQLPGCADAAIMYLSASTPADHLSHNHEFGVAVHVRKPIDPVMMLDKVDLALSELALINSRFSASPIKQPHFSRRHTAARKSEAVQSSG